MTENVIFYQVFSYPQVLLPLFSKDLEVPKLRLEILRTSKHGNKTSNFKDLMVVRFLCNSNQAWQHRNQKKLPSSYLDKEVQVKFFTTLLFTLKLLQRFPFNNNNIANSTTHMCPSTLHSASRYRTTQTRQLKQLVHRLNIVL